MRRLRARVEKIAVTDFTILIEGASGPEPHPGSMGVSCEAAVGRGDGAVEGTGEDLEMLKVA
jgi:hypothetical protein